MNGMNTFAFSSPEPTFSNHLSNYLSLKVYSIFLQREELTEGHLVSLSVCKRLFIELSTKIVTKHPNGNEIINCKHEERNR